MDQLHKRFTDEQIKRLLHGYCQGLLSRPAVQDILTISKSSFPPSMTSTASYCSPTFSLTSPPGLTSKPRAL
jgi:hypothetical protein